MLAALSQRLYDPTNQFWSQDELTLYVQESLREWNAYTGYWRGDFTFPTIDNETWYDLTTPATSLRQQLLVIDYLYTVIEYHLLEPPNGASTIWLGSTQFSLSDIGNALQQRINELLGATACVLTQFQLAGVAGRIALLPTTLDLRRVAYLPNPATGLAPSTLWQDDSWAWQSFEPDYTTLPPGIPSTYAMSTQPLLTFDVDTQLNVAGGIYEVLTSNSAITSPTGSPIVIPDDWSWLAKWGALADLLGRESNAKDLPRQRYCEQRYADGMRLLTIAPALLGIRVNNLPLEIDAVTSADQYNPSWQGAAKGTPAQALVASLNLIALTPAADSTTRSVTATVIENAPVPSVPTDPINVTLDIYEALLDEAQHIATFKMGGAEFAATIPMHQRFLSLAALYASRIAEMGQFAEVLQGQSQLDAERNPRFTSDAPTTGAGVSSGD
jgi:hypothetical protein